MYINEILIYLSLVLLGLCFGSFAGASVWRLRAKQLEQDKEAGEEVNKKEYAKLEKIMDKSIASDRSRCLSCGYVLEWYDMIPLFSWLFLGGKCRKCRKKIGSMEPIIEIGLATYFVLSYAFWPYGLDSFYNISCFVIWLISGITFAILFFYDRKWFLLPNLTSSFLVAIGLINAVLMFLASYDKLSFLIGQIVAIAILSGLYLLIYLISKGKWIGFGDIKLGLGLALLLSDWRLSFIALMAANLTGCFVVLPGLITGKLRRDSKVPFGPFLIIGTIVAYLFGQGIMGWFFYRLV